MNRDISNNDEIDINNDIYNYKGYFVENADQDDEPKYFEFGAHFRYKDLYNALKIIKKEQTSQKIKSENEEKIAQITKKKIENKERNNTRNKNMNLESNIQNILKGFKSRIRSRNIGAEQQNENQNELTFIPFNHNKNNFSVKKDAKNSNSIIYVNKTNYTNIKNKNRKSLNNSNNYNLLNKKLNTKNAEDKSNNIFMNKKFQKNVLNQMDKHRLSDKNIFSRNQGQNSLYQQVKIPPNNKTTNQNNNILNNMNFYKSYKIQISQLNKNSDKQKLFNFDESSFNYHSKDNKDKARYNYNYNFKNNQKMFQKNISNLTEPKFLYNSLNKNISDMKGKYLKLDKIKNYNLYNINKKNNANKERGKPASSNLDNILNSYRAKKLKFSPEKEMIRFMPNETGKSPSYQFNNLTRLNKNNKRISLKKNKFNDYSDYLNNRGIISVSMDNNKYISNNITIEKAKNNRKYENSNIVHISLINQSNNNNNKSDMTFPDLLNNNDFGKNYINSNQNCENVKNKINKNKREDLINYSQFNKNNNVSNNINKDNDLFNLLDKNEMYSRNKNNNYFLNNISSINFTNKKTINTTNNNNKNSNNLKKMNMTQQNYTKLLQYKNHKIQIRNKMLNFHNNIMNKNLNKNFKKNMVEISSASKKKLFTSSNDDNILSNNYKVEILNKKIQNNKNNYSYLNNLKINKSKKKISLTKYVANTTIAKENTYTKNKQFNKSLISNEVSANKSNISNNVNQLNDAKNKSCGVKKYESLIKKKPHKNNININININNNNKIIYNKIFNNKNHGLNTNPKGVKSPTLQKIRSYINNTTFEMKNNMNNNKKSNYINLQFPKAKLLNVYNSNNK